MKATRKSGGQVDIPVRRFGVVPPPPEEELSYEIDDRPVARTIGERGAVAVWLGAVMAACIAAFVVYA